MVPSQAVPFIMSTDQKELNHTQMVIINKLTLSDKARFAQLNEEKMPTDHFNYHVKTLLAEGYIEKDDDGFYHLTQRGKQFASGTDIFNKTLERQTRIHLSMVCVKDFDGVEKFLIHKRKKHPYFGWQGFPSGKPKWGNPFASEIIRELEEETGVVGNPELKLIKHVFVRLKESKELVEDKVFFFYLVNEIEQQLIDSTLEGENFWLTIEEMANAEKIYADNVLIASTIHQPGIRFLEETILVDSI